MGLGVWLILSLFYAVIGVRFLADLSRHWRETFDRNFTFQDRYRVDQAAFFILVPISVALHELGHAIVIWLFGGRVTDFGFYLFAGYVAYNEPFSKAQAIAVASAGTVVNILLIALAVAVVFLKRPPLRAAFNELLLQFAVISGANALIAYPALDLATGLEGDWSQMYFGGVPAFSLAILLIHTGLLWLGWWAWRSPVVQARVAALTAAPAGTTRRVFGGLQAGAPAQPTSPTERLLLEAARRVVAGWPEPVQVQLHQRPEGPALTLAWLGDRWPRLVIAQSDPSGMVTLTGALGAGKTPAGEIKLGERHPLGRLPLGTDADGLTLGLRLAMERVAGWAPQRAGADGQTDRRTDGQRMFPPFRRSGPGTGG